MKKYQLSDDEINDIVDRELPDEEFFQDGELDLRQALKNLVWLVEDRRISRITFDYYMEEYTQRSYKWKLLNGTQSPYI